MNNEITFLILYSQLNMKRTNDTQIHFFLFSGFLLYVFNSMKKYYMLFSECISSQVKFIEWNLNPKLFISMGCREGEGKKMCVCFSWL